MKLLITGHKGSPTEVVAQELSGVFLVPCLKYNSSFRYNFKELPTYILYDFPVKRLPYDAIVFLRMPNGETDLNIKALEKRYYVIDVAGCYSPAYAIARIIMKLEQIGLPLAVRYTLNTMASYNKVQDESQASKETEEVPEASTPQPE